MWWQQLSYPLSNHGTHVVGNRWKNTLQQRLHDYGRNRNPVQKDTHRVFGRDSSLTWRISVWVGQTRLSATKYNQIIITDDSQTRHPSKTRTEFSNQDHTRPFDNIDVDVSIGTITREVRANWATFSNQQRFISVLWREEFQSSCEEANCLAQRFRDESSRTERRLQQWSLFNWRRRIHGLRNLGRHFGKQERQHNTLEETANPWHVASPTNERNCWFLMPSGRTAGIWMHLWRQDPDFNYPPSIRCLHSIESQDVFATLTAGRSIDFMELSGGKAGVAK